MSTIDMSRVVAAARHFISKVERHDRQYDAPGYATHRGTCIVLEAGRELHFALEGREWFDPYVPKGDTGVEAFVGMTYEASTQIGILKECLRRTLRRLGIFDPDNLAAKHGLIPHLPSRDELPGDGLPEMPYLIEATDELERLSQSQVLPTLKPDTTEDYGCTHGPDVRGLMVHPSERKINRRGRRKGVNHVNLALTELTSRLKDDRPIGIHELARAVGCTPENLNQSKRFMTNYDLLASVMKRPVAGWKDRDTRNVEAVDDSDEAANF
jgi:hypothetical protein